jgi:hypothetical protein
MTRTIESVDMRLRQAENALRSIEKEIDRIYDVELERHLDKKYGSAIVHEDEDAYEWELDSEVDYGDPEMDAEYKLKGWEVNNYIENEDGESDEEWKNRMGKSYVGFDDEEAEDEQYEG